MEHAQRAAVSVNDSMKSTSLNPYFNGTCSKRRVKPTHLLIYKSES